MRARLPRSFNGWARSAAAIGLGLCAAAQTVVDGHHLLAACCAMCGVDLALTGCEHENPDGSGLDL